MCRLKFNLLCCLVICNVLFVTSFNIETFNYAIFQGGSRDSMFGFTVAVHKEGNNPWVLVGAPEQQSRYQTTVDRGGVVFKCRSDTDNVCEEIPFDREGNHITGNGDIDNKTMQWFGATLSASGRESGPIVACAPRYVWYTKDLNRKDPVGTCYVSDGYFSSFEEYSPCRTIHWGYHRQGSCQAGFSAAINNEGDRLFVGAPGSYYWQGQMYSIDAQARFNFTPGIFQETFGAKGSVFQQSLEKRPAVFSTQEGRPIDDDSYMGYSTIVGDFQNNGEQGIVVGMPRGAELHGKVLFFTWNLTNYKNMSSNKIGSYFGYSLGAGDVDGDGKLDLIVGAPMHTEPNNEGKYDVGRVYIFYHSTGGYDTFNSVDTLDGVNTKGRFGLSVSTLGDLNQDGFDDFAVGAPYDGVNGRGAVYIYYGSAEGVLKKYGQVIYAEDLNSAYPVQTFGFSVTGGMDMDGNEYPDLAVGAYLSDTAFFFRSRPVVRVEASVKFITENNLIDIKKPNCQLSNGQPGTCTYIDFCVKYSGKGIPSSILLNLQYILDSKKKGPSRMGFMKNDKYTFNETIELLKDTPRICKREHIYVKTEIRDKLTPLEAEVKYFMMEDTRRYDEQRNPRSRLQPTLDLNSPPSKKDSIIIQKNCGSDNICIPDLHLNVTSNVQKYLLGSNTNLEFDVIVENHGEDAFETTFELQYPEGIYYRKIENREHNILCSSLENRTVQCQIGNPLPASKIAVFRILFQPFHAEGMAQSYEFDMFVNSTNPENEYSMSDNHKHISIDIWIDSTLSLSGVSYPREVQFNQSRYTAEKIRKESDIGPQVVHVYNLRNKGPAAIEEAEIFFLWPYATLADEDLLYLLEQPETIGDVKCERTDANYKNYELDFHTKSIWERLEIDTSANEFTNSESLTGGVSKGHGSVTGQSSGTEEVHVESGSGIIGTIGGSKIHGQGKLDKEIGTSGDASTIHKKRLNETYTTGGRVIGGTSKQIQSYFRTYTLNGVPYRNETNITTIRDAKGNIINEYTDSKIFKGDEARFRFYQGQDGSQPKIYYTSSGGGDRGSTFTFDGQRGQQSGQSGQRGQSGQGSYRQESFHRQSGQQGGTGGTSGGQTFREESYFSQGGRGGGQAGSRGQQGTFSQSGQSGQRGYQEESHYSQSGQSSGQSGRQGSGQSSQQGGQTGGNRGYQEESHYSQSGQIGRQGSGQSGQQGGQSGHRGYQEETHYSQSGQAGQQGSGGQRFDQRWQQQSGGRQQSGGSSETHQSGGGTFGYQSGGERGGQGQGGSYEEHRESSYEIRQGNQEQGGGGGVVSGGRVTTQHGQQSGQYGGQAGGSAGSVHFSQTGGQSGESVNYGQQSGQTGGQVVGGTRYHIRARPGGGKHYTITGRYEVNGQGEGGQSGQGGQQSGGSQEYSSHQQSSWGGKTVEDNAIQHGSGETQRHRGRGGYVDANGVFHAYSQNSSSSSESQGRGSQVFGDLGIISGGGNFGEEAALGHGFTFNTLNVGGIQGQTESSNRNPQFKQVWHTEETVERTGDIPPTYFNTIERDNVPTDRPDYNNPVHRGRRDVTPQIDIKCNSTKCIYMRCVVGRLKKDKEVSIALRSRVNVRAIEGISSTQPIKFSSMMVGRISKLPYIGRPKTTTWHSHEIFTEIPAQGHEIRPYVIPLWVVVLSAVAGTLALLLIIYLFYKCGFFKRNRPPSGPERQPLNRNGYNHGDEAL